MARDYARRTSSSKARKRQRNPYKTMLFIVVIACALYFLTQTGELQLLKQRLISSLTPATAPVKTKTAQRPVSKQPRFEFYTLLPKNNPHSEIEPVKTPVSNSAPVTIVTTSSKGTNPTPTNSSAKEAAPVNKALAATNTAATNTTTVPGHTAQAAKVDKGTYMLQVASFRTIGEADNLKAKLALTGFDVSIEKFNYNGMAWYRVRVGPFGSQVQAHAASERLLRQKYRTIVRRIG